MTSITTAPDLAETCARRGITRVVHCHADHFEPEAVAKQIGANADMHAWWERCKPAVPTLYVKCPVGFVLDSTSEIGMSLRLNNSAAIEADYLRALVSLGAEVGLHVHHEAWTSNACPKLSPSQQALHDVAMRTPAMDGARLSAMTAGALAWLRETIGRALDEWSFVHGCWAFGASDPEICQVLDELPRLYALGCRADVSFPAGRRYCDPLWSRPMWVRPVVGERAFERPDADPREGYSDGRMLVWASHADAWWLGLDTYSDDSRRLMDEPEKIERHLALCPVIAGTAYVKTCAHSMHPYYWSDGPRPTLGAFASELAETCSRAGVEVAFRTVDAVVRELRAVR